MPRDKPPPITAGDAPAPTRISPESLAFVGIGSNLGDSIQIVQKAINRLASLSTRPVVASDPWETSPVGCPPGSPMFINAVAGVYPSRDEGPEGLLERLLVMELEFGPRPRRRQNEPRYLDLDLLLYGPEIRKTRRLTLPHPHAYQRRFVLAPLHQIAPRLRFPGWDRPVEELLAACPGRETARRLSSAVTGHFGRPTKGRGNSA